MRYYPDELYHFGIKGMKWGVRRFQRKDGSYTKQGLARERNGSNGSTKGDKAARRERIKKIAKGAAIAGLAVGGTYLAYKNRDKIGKLIGGKKTGPATSSTQIDAKQMAANIKAIDKVTHQQVPFNRKTPRQQQAAQYFREQAEAGRAARAAARSVDRQTFGSRSVDKIARTKSSRSVNKSMVKDLARKRKNGDAEAFKEFDRGMMDRDAKMVFGGGNGIYFKKSDGSTITPNWDAALNTRAWKRKSIKGGRLNKQRR